MFRSLQGHKERLFQINFILFLWLVYLTVQELLDHKIQPVRTLEVTELKGLSGVKLYCFVHVLNNCCQCKTVKNSQLVITQTVLYGFEGRLKKFLSQHFGDTTAYASFVLVRTLLLTDAFPSGSRALITI